MWNPCKLSLFRTVYWSSQHNHHVVLCTSLAKHLPKIVFNIPSMRADDTGACWRHHPLALVSSDPGVPKPQQPGVLDGGHLHARLWLTVEKKRGRVPAGQAVQNGSPDRSSHLHCDPGHRRAALHHENMKPLIQGELVCFFFFFFRWSFSPI